MLNETAFRIVRHWNGVQGAKRGAVDAGRMGLFL